MLHERHIEDLVAKYVRNGDVIAIGTSKTGEVFLKKLAFAIEERGIGVSVIPTSMKHAAIASSLGLKIASINDSEIDLAVEFVDMVDEDYNYIKRDSSSLVRDKMIAQSAATLIAVARKEDFVKRLKGKMAFEVATFGWGRTLLQLDSLGKAKLRESAGKPYKTESNNYLIDVEIGLGYELEDLEFKAKEIPGVLETGLFLGYADKILLHNHDIEVKSRTEFK